MIMEVTNKCNSSSMLGILSIVKRVLVLIQIFVPILLIVFAIFSLIKLLKNPDEKDGTKKIINQFLAAVIVFFIPLLVDMLMGLLGEKVELSSCWKKAENNFIIGNKYFESGKKKKKFMPDAKKYEEGKSTNGMGTAELAVRVAPIAYPDSTTIYGPHNFVSAEVSASCGGMSPLPNPWYPPSQVDARYKNFEKIMDAVINDQRPGNKAYGSCAQAAGGIIRATVDPDFNTANPAGQIEYLQNNPDKWEFVHQMKSGEKFDDFCEPGDVLVTVQGWEHTAIYVGSETASKKFSGTKGNIFQAGYAPCDHAKYPRIDYMETAPVPFKVYRATGGGNFKYDFIDVEAVLGN